MGVEAVASLSLEELGLVGAELPKEFQNVTELASVVLDAPVALVSMVQPELGRQFFSGSVGLGEPWKSSRQTPISHSFCRHVVETDDTLAIVDSRLDPLVAGNPAVVALGVVSYLGAPIYRSGGRPIGALCVIGHEPRQWVAQEVERLERLASCVSDAVQARENVMHGKRLQAELTRVQARLTDAVQAGNVGLWERDLDTGDFWVSPEYDELHGGTTNSWVGLESLIARFHPDDQRELESIMLAGRIPGHTYEWIYRFRLDDGSYRWLRSLSTLSDRDGASRLAGATVDITSEREREDRIKALNAEVADTNADLGEFVRIASHDLRSPIRAISGLIELLREDVPDLPEAALRRLDQMTIRAARMMRLLDDLLAYLASDTKASEPELVDLTELAEDALGFIDCPNELELVVEANTTSAVVDRVAVATAIRNLADNAVKHSRGRPGAVRVAFHRIDDDLVVEVQDAGPGIPEEYLERIFLPFETLQAKDAVEGSGIGLAIVQRLLKRTGGSIEVESSVGEGSTFRMRWPGGSANPIFESSVGGESRR